MANTVQDVVSWAQTFVRLLPVSGVGGSSYEPALSLANQVQQTILAPPFAWNWNRAVTTFPTVSGTQDYVQSGIANLAWLERASLQSGSSDLPSLEVAPVLDAAQTTGHPTHIAAILNGSGGVTFRLFPTPDAVYTVAISYQIQAPNITALTSTWAVPDYLAHLYRQGMLAGFLGYADDQRAPLEYQKFLQLTMVASTGFNTLRDPRQLGLVEAAPPAVSPAR